MRRRLRNSTAAVTLVLCVLGCIGPASPANAQASASVQLGGINAGLGSSAAEIDQTLSAAQALHAKIIRFEVPWSVLEPRASGQMNPQTLAELDRFTSGAAAKGIGVILMIDRTPCWASSAPPALLSSCVPGQGGAADSWPPRDPADFAALVKALAERYSHTITAIEVWNEPDQANEKYFAGPEKARRYAALLIAADTAIKQADPAMKVLGGSLVGTNGAFLRLLYQYGIKGHYDGLAVHFYTLTLAGLRSIRAVQTANGDAAPLWLDEFGWPNCYPRQQIQEEQACVTSATQALNVTNMFRELRTAKYVAAATLYEMQDGGGDSFGALTTTGARKPSFSALSKVLASPFGSPSPVTLSLKRVHGSVLAQGSGPVGDFMQLEAFKGKALRFRATFTLDRSNRYSVTLPPVLGTRGLRIRVFQSWTGLAHAAQKRI
jgi:Cellulase (glycosyl hydrolase family 5)